MKPFNRFMTLILLGSVGTASFAFNTQAVARTKNTECNAAIAAARKKLLNVRNIKMESEGFSDVSDPQGLQYTDFPEGRPQSYGFRMTGSGIDTVMGSDKFLTAMAKNIITHCQSVGLVSFGFARSGYVVFYGLMPNGNVESFKCLEPEPGVYPKWGYRICT